MSRLLPLITYFVVSAVLACAAYVSANASAGARKFRNVILAKSGNSTAIRHQSNIALRFRVKTVHEEAEQTDQDEKSDKPDQKSHFHSDNSLNRGFELSSPLLLGAFYPDFFSPEVNSWKNPLTYRIHPASYEIYIVTDIRLNPSTGPPAI
ncbi:MAG: hypothetical protein ACRBBN_02970 [Methyloligellaceae bacterium]